MTNHGLSLTVYLWAVSIYRDGATPESGIELRVLNSLSSMPNTQQALQLKKKILVILDMLFFFTRSDEITLSFALIGLATGLF